MLTSQTLSRQQAGVLVIQPHNRQQRCAPGRGTHASSQRGKRNVSGRLRYSLAGALPREVTLKIMPPVLRVKESRRSGQRHWGAVSRGSEDGGIGRHMREVTLKSMPPVLRGNEVHKVRKVQRQAQGAGGTNAQ